MDTTNKLRNISNQWSRYFDHDPSGQLIFLKDHVCFYGGTFNPWHEGHQACLEKAKNFYQESADVVIILDNNPWKQSQLNEEQKVKLFQNVLEKSKHPLIYPGFLLSDELNPTFDWIKKFKEKNKTKVDLLIGYDNFEKFSQWKNYRELLKIIDQLLVVSRQDNDAKKSQMLEHIKEISPSTKVQMLGKHAYEDLSSSSLRN